MRAAIRSVVVGTAVLGLAGFGAASAQAGGHGHHKPCCKTNVVNKEWTKKTQVSIAKDNIIFAPMLNKKYEFEFEGAR